MKVELEEAYRLMAVLYFTGARVTNLFIGGNAREARRGERERAAEGGNNESRKKDIYIGEDKKSGA